MNESELKQIIKQMRQMEEYVYNHEIAARDFCLPSCSRDKFELNIDTESVIPGAPEDTQLAYLSFAYNKGEYHLIEEHFLYDTWNFIPDVGGYLGLLLGYSLLSLYHVFAQWLIDAKQKLMVGKKRGKESNTII